MQYFFALGRNLWTRPAQVSVSGREEAMPRREAPSDCAGERYAASYERGYEKLEESHG